MIALLSHYWGWLALAAGIGFLGAKTAHDHEHGGTSNWLSVLAVLLGLGLIGSLLGLVVGPLGTALATAGLSFLAFALGAALGGGFQARGFWWGPLIVAGLVWVCSTSLLNLAPAAAPAGVAEAQSQAPAAKPTLADKKTAAIAAAKTLPASGQLDAGQCQTALAGLIAAESVKFDTGSTQVSQESRALIARIGSALGRCPATIKVEIAGYTDSTGDAGANKALSQKRAEAVAELLKTGGAGAEQFTAVGYGPERPVESNDTPEGRAENRRIEFTVK